MSLRDDMQKNRGEREERLVLAPRPRPGFGKLLLGAALALAFLGGAASYGFIASRPAVPQTQFQAQSRIVMAPAAITAIVEEPAKDVTGIVAAAQTAAPSQPAELGLSISKAKLAALPVSQAARPPTDFKVIRPHQRSDNLYRQALMQLQQGRAGEAQGSLHQALEIHAANHAARLLLAELLNEAGQRNEAEALMRDGLAIAPDNGGLRMALAQMQASGGETAAAAATLEQGLAAAGDDAAYQAMLAALQQKLGRHADAIGHYLVALRENPGMPAWLVGAGISLQAENLLDDAEAAFQRALDTGELSGAVAEFANQRLARIREARSKS